MFKCKEKMQRFFSDRNYAVAWGIASLVAALIMLTIFLLVSSFTSIGHLGNEIDNKAYPSFTISVHGKGESLAKPDIATISFSSIDMSESVASAQSASADKVKKAVDMLKQNGVDEKDIKTTSYSVYPKKEWQSPVCPAIYPSTCSPGREVTLGFEVSQTTQVKVRDTSKVGDLLSKIGELGITDISGPNFEVDDLESVKADARNKAIENAKQEAKKIAKELGVELKGIVSFYENQGAPVYDGYGMGAAETKAVVAPVVPTVSTGEQTITSEVDITFKIED